MHWTVNNLANGDLHTKLPAWKWGESTNNKWGLLDENSASDANIWLAYSLLEAGRLWQYPAFIELGKSLLQSVKQEEVIDMSGLGLTLLPGTHGFALSPSQWRLNPSYAPIQLLRAFAEIDPAGPWNDMATATATLIIDSSPKGIVPDWIVYDEEQGFISDPDFGRKGSYDAIRTYLWIGMLAHDEPLKASLIKSLGFHCKGKSWPPEFSNTLTGERYGYGSLGFSAAVIPWLAAKNDQHCLTQQVERLASVTKKTASTEPNYYDENLKLFALNWKKGDFKFDKSGRLRLAWEKPCL